MQSVRALKFKNHLFFIFFISYCFYADNFLIKNPIAPKNFLQPWLERKPQVEEVLYFFPHYT